MQVTPHVWVAGTPRDRECRHRAPHDRSREYADCPCTTPGRQRKHDRKRNAVRNHRAGIPGWPHRAHGSRPPHPPRPHLAERYFADYVVDYVVGQLYAQAEIDPRVRWTFRADAKISATPLLHNGTVYVTSWDQRIYALDTETGRERWRFKTGNAITTTPAAHGERVFVASRDGILYALDRGSGKELWRMQTGAWFDSSPVAGAWANRWGDETEAPQRLFVGCHDRALYAVDPATGGVCWRFPMWNWVLSRPAVANYAVFCASLDGAIYALDARCGGMLWSYRIDLGVGELAKHARFRVAYGALACERPAARPHANVKAVDIAIPEAHRLRVGVARE